MTESISRAFTGDIEVRASAEGRTIAGIIVPWDRKARVSDGGPSYDEMFRRGSLAKTIRERADRVKFLSQHNSRTNPLGVARVLREDAAGAYGEFVVSKTQAGDEALELVRDGALDSFSVGFTPVKHEKRDGVEIHSGGFRASWYYPNTLVLMFVLESGHASWRPVAGLRSLNLPR